MDSKLLEILKKAKQVDERAKQFDKKGIDASPSVNTRPRTEPTITEAMGRMGDDVYSTPQQMSTPKRTNTRVNVNSGQYEEMVKKSKLPPEIQRLMLENPIPQPDMPGTFSLDEEAIREVNPGYRNDGYVNNNVVNEHIETPQPTTSGTVNEGVIRKMIAEEIARALPSIVESYFDKKMIQENIDIWKTLKVRRKQQ